MNIMCVERVRLYFAATSPSIPYSCVTHAHVTLHTHTSHTPHTNYTRVTHAVDTGGSAWLCFAIERLAMLRRLLALECTPMCHTHTHTHTSHMHHTHSTHTAHTRIAHTIRRASLSNTLLPLRPPIHAYMPRTHTHTHTQTHVDTHTHTMTHMHA